MRPRRPRARAPPARSSRRRRRSGRAARSRRARPARARASKRSSTAGDRSASANVAAVTLERRDRPLPRLGGLADVDPPRLRAPTCATSPSGTATARSRQIDVRVLADYAADLGRARPGGKLAPATIARRLSAVRALLRFSLGPGTCPTSRSRRRRGRRLPDAPKAAEVEAILEAARRAGGAARAPQPRAARARLLGGAAQRRGGRSRPRRRRLRAGARPRPQRQGREGPDRAARRGGRPLGRPLPPRGPPRARPRRRRRTLPLRARPPPRHLDAAPPHAAPAPPAPRVRDAPARGRRRPAHDPGAARPLVALDDPDLQPRRAPSACAASTTARTRAHDARPHGARGRSWRCSRRGARRGPSTPTAATSPRCARSSATPSRPRRSTSSSATRPSSAPTGSRPRRSRGAPRRRGRSSATCS